MLSSYPVSLGTDTSVYAKTPGKTLKRRNALQENVIRGPMTIKVKTKGALTPHRPLTTRAQKVLRDSAKPTVTVSRPLGDKTPFPNRFANAVPHQTPAPPTEKLVKLSLLDPAQAVTPGALLPPSSARKSLRLPRTSGSGNLYEFKTPVTQGNHWDVSDGDIDLEVSEAGAEEKVQVQEEDYDEIEYMAPTAILPPYEPPFEMPDYKVLGRKIWELAHSAKYDDAVDLYYAADIEIEIDPQEVWQASGFVSSPSKWERLELPEIDDDSPIPRRATKPTANASAKSDIHLPTTLRSTLSSQHPSTDSSSRPLTRSRAAANASTRPATGTSIKNPTSRVATRPTASRAALSSAPGARPIASTSSSRPTASIGTRASSTARKPARASSIPTRQFVSATKSSTCSAAASSKKVAAAPATRDASGAGRTVGSSSLTKGVGLASHGRHAGTSRIPLAKAAPGHSSGASAAVADQPSEAAEDELLLVFEDGDLGDLAEDFVFDV